MSHTIPALPQIGAPTVPPAVAFDDERSRAPHVSKGTVKGRVEKLDTYDRHEFVLVPPIGDGCVRCTFPGDLFDAVRGAVGRSVTVTGRLTYRADSPYPDRAEVESIEVHPPDHELPSLWSLRGLMRGGTDGKSAVEFVEALRDE